MRKCPQTSQGITTAQLDFHLMDSDAKSGNMRQSQLLQDLKQSVPVPDCNILLWSTYKI